MKNGGGHFTPELGGHFELESGAHFKLELGGQYHWDLHHYHSRNDKRKRRAPLKQVLDKPNGTAERNKAKKRRETS